MPDTARNLIKQTISNTPGTSGALTLSSAASGWLALGAGDDGLSFSVTIYASDSPTAAKEVRTGCVYTHGTLSLSRGTLESGTAINLTSSAVVMVTQVASTENKRLVGPYATAAALQSAFAAASYRGSFGIVGSSAPYDLYWSDGSAWILSVARANPLVTIASSGASFTQSAVNASVLDVTLTGNCTIAFSNVPAGAYTVRLILRQDATGSRTVTWPSGISWDGSGSAPSLRSTPAAFDDIELTTVDGGTTWIARNLRAQQAANPASYGLTHIRNDGSTSQTFTGNTNTKLAACLTTVVSNADGWWDTTNKKFQPTVAGKYLITVGAQTGATSIQLVAQVAKNGTLQGNGTGAAVAAYSSSQNTQVITMNGTTDYAEAYVYHSGNSSINPGADNTYFKALFLGA